MKPTARLRHFLCIASTVLAAVNSASAIDYYWNQNSTSPGWGAGGAWSTSSAVFTAAPEDAVGTAETATTDTGDTLYIGSATTGFAGGTIALSGTQSIGSIITGSANTTASVIISNNTLTFAASGTLTNNSSQELVIGSVIAGAGTRLDLNGTGGGITLSAVTNTYTGVTYVNSGTITVNHGGGFGTTAGNTVVASGARINFNETGKTFAEAFNIAGAGVGGTTGALFVTANRDHRIDGAITLSGNATIYTDSGDSSFDLRGGINLGSNALTFHTQSSTSFQTVQTIGISGSGGSIIKTGAGLLSLKVANSYTGNTTISGGTLEMTGSFIESSPIIYIGNGAKLKNTTGSITLQSGKSIIGTGATGFVETNSSVTTSVTALGNNTISNNNSGTLTLNRLDVFGSGNQITQGNIVAGTSGGSRGLVIGNGSNGTLTITGGSFTSNNGSNADVLGNGAGNGTLIINGGSYTTAGTLSLGLNASASGTLTLTTGSVDIGTLAYAAGASGSGIVNLNGGFLTINTITSSSGGTRQFNFDGGQLIASGSTSFASTLTLNVRDGGAKINTNGNSVSILGNLVTDGSGGLTKSGAGTLTLSGTGNTYTGATIVKAGTLKLDTATTLSTSSSLVAGDTGSSGAVLDVTTAGLTVASTKTLAGIGTVLATGKTVTVNGTLAAGDGGAGALAISGGNLTMGASSIFEWDINTTANTSDSVSVGGTLSVVSGANFKIVSSTDFSDAFWNTTRSWNVFGGKDFEAFNLSFLANNVSLNAGDFASEGNFAFTSSGTNLTWTAIPEPTSALAGLLLTAGLLRRRRN